MSEPESKKQPYEKPTMRKIDLAAEEVLAAGCKTQTTVNAPDQIGSVGCEASSCFETGS